MSTPHSHIPPLEVRERAACMCVHGRACSTFAPGHALHLIQARLASATPSDWVDAIVDVVSADGTVVLRTIADAAPITVWSGSGAAQEISSGTPVAFHERYHVLAAGQRRFNVAPLAHQP
ncbi:hypothetical protein [Microbacterium sp. BK668]|uniref:hypothetical protein n=1 Tax=Microbacterium sp. BK668 TaxID=2512118 RepID=UPI0010D73301|nr:hypothetical protein [Microbacterium sp. BK668]TDN93211.1 hypothetical protein EV279_2754 [Microbacterium sp. BK668]